MLNLENLETLRFWRSEEGKHLLALLDECSPHLGFEIASYPLQSCADLLSYLGNSSVLQHLERGLDSDLINVLDIGCGNGWEAFGLAFLLQPAAVVGISNDQDEFQSWDIRSNTVGAILNTLPRLVQDVDHALVWISDATLQGRLDSLCSVMKIIQGVSLEFMQHDIQTTQWPRHMLSFDLVFSKSSFYHTQDRIQALRNIKGCLADTGIYVLHEPSVRNDGSPDLTPEWFSEVAVQKVGFTHSEILDSSELASAVLLRK